MGKTYKGHKKGKKDQKQLPETSRESQKAGVGAAPRPASNHPAMDRYEDLKTNLLTRHPNGSIKTILFAGTTHGNGASTTAINFATALARDSQLKVLLMDVNLRTPSFHDVFKIDQADGLMNLISGKGLVASHIKRVGLGNLFVLACRANHSEPLALFESKRFDQFLKLTREKFDYVILDAPPVSRFSECRVLGAKVDGVVLVVASGKTRRQVALRAKKELQDVGGKLLGVVLNKRRHYIPDFIYRRL